jgi:hypothetical protein
MNKEIQQLAVAAITLRDHFAGCAMQGLLSADPENRWDAADCAKFAYQQADAMLEVREAADE